MGRGYPWVEWLQTKLFTNSEFHYPEHYVPISQPAQSKLEQVIIVDTFKEEEVRDSWAFYLHAALLRQAFTHYEKFPTAAFCRILGHV